VDLHARPVQLMSLDPHRIASPEPPESVAEGTARLVRKGDHDDIAAVRMYLEPAALGIDPPDLPIQALEADVRLRSPPLIPDALLNLDATGVQLATARLLHPHPHVVTPLQIPHGIATLLMDHFRPPVVLDPLRSSPADLHLDPLPTGIHLPDLTADLLTETQDVAAGENVRKGTHAHAGTGSETEKSDTPKDEAYRRRRW
jgi:hypothetical protein